jgi:hypothetical protein
MNGSIYINKEATGRIFRFDVHNNRLIGFSTNTVQTLLAGTAVEGDKLFMLPYKDGANTVYFLYALRHSAVDNERMMVI